MLCHEESVLLNPSRNIFLLLFAVLGTAQAFAENSNTTNPVPTPPHTTITKASRNSIEFETQKSAEGTQLLLEKSTFSDGSSVRRLAGLRFEKGEFQVEVLLVNDFQLPTQELKKPQDSFKVLEKNSFTDSAKVTLRTTTLFVKLEDVLEQGLPENARSLCSPEEYPAVANIAQPPMTRSSSIPNTTQKEESYFKLSNVVCVAIVT